MHRQTDNRQLMHKQIMHRDDPEFRLTHRAAGIVNKAKVLWLFALFWLLIII